MTMPYSELSDLPAPVRDHLPKHAQEIFQAAFNSAYREYNHNEERSFKVAWAAVGKEYRKGEGGRWVKR